MAGKERIQIDIDLKDDASQQLSDIAKLAEALDAEKVEIPVDADTSQAERGMRELGDESDQTRSVLANMAGNASQDMGELAGVSGTAGVAIGQLAEYATEGNIRLSNLAKTAGPMLALAAVTKVVGDHLAKINAAKAFDRDQVEGWVDAMREGVSQTEAMVEGFREAGKVEVTIGDDLVDLRLPLSNLGLTVEQFVNLTHRSEAEIAAWGEGMVEAGADTESLTFVLGGAAAAHEQIASSAAIAAVNEDVFGEAAADAEENVDNLTAAYDRLRGSLSEESAYLAAQQGFSDLEDAAFEAYTTAATGSEDAEQAQRDYQQSVIDSKERVIDYAEELGNIPPDVVSDIITLIDQGKLTEAQAAIDRLDEREVEIPVRPRPQGWEGWNGWSGGWAPPGSGPRAMGATNITINAPRGMNATDLFAAANAYVRRNGALRRV